MLVKLDVRHTPMFYALLSFLTVRVQHYFSPFPKMLLLSAGESALDRAGLNPCVFKQLLGLEVKTDYRHGDK